MDSTTACSTCAQVWDVTRCALCHEPYWEPKALPCIHTFCLQCLDRHCEGKEKDEVSCPLCRKVFKIPVGGNVKLPNNLCIHGVLEAKHSAERSAENSTPSSTKLINLSANICAQHSDQQITLYCYDCEVVTCNVCLVNRHRKHDLIDVNNSAERFRQQLKDDFENMLAYAPRNLDAFRELKIDKDLFKGKIASTRHDIERLSQIFSPSRKLKLMEELDTFENKILKMAGTHLDEIVRQTGIVESLEADVQKLLNRGTIWDISRTAHSLHNSAEEFGKTRDKPHWRKLSEVQITYEPSIPTADYAKEFKLVFEDKFNFANNPSPTDFRMFLGRPAVHHIINEPRAYIGGLTILGGEVFVVRYRPQVYVYKSDDFTLIRVFTIEQSQELIRIASCSHYNCLYISDSGQDLIYRYDITSNVTTVWSVIVNCPSLSITKCHNVLVIPSHNDRTQYPPRTKEYTTDGELVGQIGVDSNCYPSHCVEMSTGNYAAIPYCTSEKEYTTDGKLVEQIGVESNCYPSHCVEMSTGNYAAIPYCTSETSQAVCVLDRSGRIIWSCGSDIKTSGLLHLAVDMHDNVLIVDYDDNRIILLSPTLIYLGDIEVPENTLCKPVSVSCDELNHRLYILEVVINEDLCSRMFAVDVNTGSNDKALDHQHTLQVI